MPAISLSVVILMRLNYICITKLKLIHCFGLLTLLFPINLSVTGQNNVPELKLKLVWTDQNEHIGLDTGFVDSASMLKELNAMISTKQNEGYFECSLDSLIETDSAYLAHVHLGPIYNFLRIHPPEIPPFFRLKGLQWPYETGEKANLNKYKKWSNAILTAAENNGYPFASLAFDSISSSEPGTVNARIKLDLHTYFTIDSIGIWGDTVVNRNFLYNYLGFRPGDPYNEALVKQIDRKLDQLQFLKRTGPSRVYFIYNKVLIIVRLEERKSSRFDGIVGLAPNSENTDGGLLLTGEVNLDIQNILSQGVEMKLFWKSFLNNSQELKLNFASPFILRTPLGPEVGLDFMRFDTLFTDLQWKAGLKYQLNNGLQLGFVYEQRNTGLLGVDTVSIRNTRRLPNGNPTLSRMYGMQLALSSLDKVDNPRKGVRLRVEGLIGNKQILRDNRVEAVQFVNTEGQSYSVYDSLNEFNRQSKYTYHVETYLPVGKRSTLAFHINGRHWLSPEVFFNELYRFGGYATLKGFDENAFFAASMTIANLEWRYLYSEGGFAGVFFNVARYSRPETIGTEAFMDWPYGFGAIARIEVGNGLLNIAYALGSEQNNPLQFRTAKVHFGLINYF
jgi:translocation and assembly module TamA